MFHFLLKRVPTVVGLLFSYAAIHKLLYPGEATLALYALDIPFDLASWIVSGTIIVEFYLGALLLMRIDLKATLTLSMILMFLFTAFMWYLSTLAHPPACGCLGLTGIFKSSRHAALFGLFRNVVILLALKSCYDYYFKSNPLHEIKAAQQAIDH